jgi:hypothetical protein
LEGVGCKRSKGVVVVVVVVVVVEEQNRKKEELTSAFLFGGWEGETRRTNRVTCMHVQIEVEYLHFLSINAHVITSPTSSNHIQPLAWKGRRLSSSPHPSIFF